MAKILILKAKLAMRFKSARIFSLLIGTKNSSTHRKWSMPNKSLAGLATSFSISEGISVSGYTLRA